MTSSQKDKNPSIGRKKYLRRVLAFFFSSFSRGQCTTLDQPDHCELEGKIKLRYACELDLDLFFKFIKISYLILSVNFRSVLICYTTLPRTPKQTAIMESIEKFAFEMIHQQAGPKDPLLATSLSFEWTNIEGEDLFSFPVSRRAKK